MRILGGILILVVTNVVFLLGHDQRPRTGRNRSGPARVRQTANRPIRIMLVNTYLDFSIELIGARAPKTLKSHCGYGPKPG